MKKSIFIFPLLVLLYSCTTQQNDSSKADEVVVVQDPLSAWNDASTKQSIISYVNAVTDSASADFVPVADRIAVFDNDGTLWCEQPAYTQLIFVLDRIREMAPSHPEWSKQQPFKAAIEGDLDGLAESGMEGLMTLLMHTHSGVTTDEFKEIVESWMKNAKHPRYNVTYDQLVYQPMIELLHYLRAHNFKTYIVSGGGVEFMRPVTDRIYGIPAEQVIGSTVKTVFEYNDGNPVIKKLPEIDFIDDKELKPVAINKIIGKKPIFAAGNSDGDLAMLQWSASSDHKSLQLYVHHTDSVREYAYDRNSHVGKLDKGLDQALNDGWAVADMEKDWKRVFSFEK